MDAALPMNLGPGIWGGQGLKTETPSPSAHNPRVSSDWFRVSTREFFVGGILSPREREPRRQRLDEGSLPEFSPRPSDAGPVPEPSCWPGGGPIFSLSAGERAVVRGRTRSDSVGCSKTDLRPRRHSPRVRIIPLRLMTGRKISCNHSFHLPQEPGV